MAILIRVACLLLAVVCGVQGQPGAGPTQANRVKLAGHVVGLNMELLEVLPVRLGHTRCQRKSTLISLLSALGVARCNAEKGHWSACAQRDTLRNHYASYDGCAVHCFQRSPVQP